MNQINIMLQNLATNFDNLMLNSYFSTIVIIFLTVYASFASPKLPNYVKKLFDNSIFKIIIISFIGYRANKDPQLSLIIAIAFIVTLNFLSEKETKESFQNIETFQQLEHFNNKLDTNQRIEAFDDNADLDSDSNTSNSDSDSNASNSDSDTAVNPDIIIDPYTNTDNTSSETNESSSDIDELYNITNPLISFSKLVKFD